MNLLPSNCTITPCRVTTMESPSPPPSHTGSRILIAVLWIFNAWIGYLYLSPMRTRPVWDLPQFYFAAKLCRAGQISDLYHKEAYAPFLNELRRINPSAAKYSVYFNRPAFDALLFLPLAYLSYGGASTSAIVVNFALLGILVWKVPRWLQAPASTRIWLLAFMPFLHSIAFGQDTLLLTILVAFALHRLDQGHEVSAGVVLAFGAFKPHLLWAIPLALAASKKRKMLYAFLATGTLLALFSVLLVGPEGVKEWVRLLQEPTTDCLPASMVNIRALGIHSGSVAAVWAAAVAVVSFGILLKGRQFYETFAAALIIALLLTPHVYLPDYSLLAIVALVSPYSAARYLLILPWAYFWPSKDSVPFAVLAVTYLAVLAAKPLFRCARRSRPALGPLADGPTLSGHSPAGQSR